MTRSTSITLSLRPLGAVVLTLCALSACKKEPPTPQRAEPSTPGSPASAQAPTSSCEGGGGTLQDPTIAPFFPRQSGGYCIDPRGETRIYGEGSAKNIDAICLEAFDGECEVYKSFGLQKVVTFRYVDGAGSPGTVDIVLSKYTSVEGAYGMFTQRVISDGDPARADAPKDLKVPGAGAQGTGSAYLWKGLLVVELTYTNEKETPQQLTATSEKLLRTLGASIAEKLPGPATLPLSASKLPEAHRVPLGILFQPKDPFGIKGEGAGAYGFYQEGQKRYRVLSITRADADQAKDALGSIAQRPGATKQKDVGEGAVRLMTSDSDEAPKQEWVVARKGNQVLGVGDEPSVLQGQVSAADREKVLLTKDEKVKKLRELLESVK